MFEIKGLDKVEAELAQLQQFMKELDGEMGTVSFDSENPESVVDAIQEMEDMVDNKAQKYSSNPTIMEMVAGIKNNFKQQINGSANEHNDKGNEDE